MLRLNSAYFAIKLAVCRPFCARKSYRFFFYMADRYEPPHIHVAKEDSAAKFWLDPLELEFNGWLS
jgi:Domain of unknown function (DUF4160)